MRRTGLLGEEKVVTLLQGDTVTVEEVSFQFFHRALRRRISYLPRVLVIGREASGVGRLGDLAV